MGNWFKYVAIGVLGAGLIYATLTTLSLAAVAQGASDSGSTVRSLDVRDVVKIHDANHAGSGCPQGYWFPTIRTSQGNKGVMKISFGDYEAAAGGDTLQDRRSCNVAIPVKLPVGTRLVVQQAEVKGSLDLESGAKAMVKMEASLSGARGKPVVGSVSAPEAGLTGELRAAETGVLATPCGGERSLWIKSSARVHVSEPSTRFSRVQVERTQLTLRLERCR
jgi:hypothetical protein